MWKHYKRNDGVIFGMRPYAAGESLDGVYIPYNQRGKMDTLSGFIARHSDKADDLFFVPTELHQEIYTEISV